MIVIKINGLVDMIQYKVNYTINEHPDLFKLEFEGDGIIALASKMYYCFGENDKFSCRGINQ